MRILRFLPVLSYLSLAGCSLHHSQCCDAPIASAECPPALAEHCPPATPPVVAANAPPCVPTSPKVEIRQQAPIVVNVPAPQVTIQQQPQAPPPPMMTQQPPPMMMMPAPMMVAQQPASRIGWVVDSFKIPIPFLKPAVVPAEPQMVAVPQFVPQPQYVPQPQFVQQAMYPPPPPPPPQQAVLPVQGQLVLPLPPATPALAAAPLPSAMAPLNPADVAAFCRQAELLKGALDAQQKALGCPPGGPLPPLR